MAQTDVHSSQCTFGIYNGRDKRFIRKLKFKSARKLSRPKILIAQ